MPTWLGDLVRLFFPDICAACGHSLLKGEKALCTRCLYMIPRTNYHLSRENPVAQLFWGRVEIEHATAFFIFESGSLFQSLIHHLKYNGRQDVGMVLGHILGLELKNAEGFDSVERIIPVPLHPTRQRERGYNQSECIARGIAGAMSVKLDAQSLVRTGRTGTQTKKNRIERWENVRNKFRVNGTDGLQHTHVLLVDDVVTTGATLEACAETLLAIPGLKVSIATLAVA